MLLLKNIFPLLLLTLSLSLTAQDDIKVPRKSFKTSSDGFSEAYKHIKTGDKLVRKGAGGITEAIEEYKKAYTYNPQCPELNYKIGLTYLRSGTKSEAIKYIKVTVDKLPDTYVDETFQYAKALQYNYEFDKATDQFMSFSASLSRRGKKKYGDEITDRLEQCKVGKNLVSQPKRVIIKNVGDRVNTEYNDYNAIVLGDTVMYFSSRSPRKKNQNPSPLNYMYDEDVFVSHYKKGEWQRASRVEDDGVNSDHNDAIVWITYDNQKRYIYDGYRNNGDILVSEYKNGEWKSPKKIRKDFNSPFQETSLSITKDEQTAYFVSKDETESYGGKDIYVVRKNSKGKWDSPENVGSVINTPEDEEGVFVTPDGNALYFSSKGHNSMGGYDVFRSERKANGAWTKPENIGYPVNTPDDELFFRTSSNEKIAYFASKRSDSYGGFDIYKATYLGAEKKMELSGDDDLVAFLNKPQLYLRMPETTKVDTVVTYSLTGRVVDAKRGTPVLAKVDLIDVENAQSAGATLTDTLGRYRINLTKLKSYGVEIRAKDYMIYLDRIDVVKPAQGTEIVKDFKVVKIEAGVKIVLKNIYFESGKAVLTVESFPELDKVVKFMQETPDLKIEISGHTDNVGAAAANTKLSAARAKAVVDYVASKGVPIERMVSKGYGPLQPIAPNTTAAGKKMNRRVEFKILSTE